VLGFIAQCIKNGFLLYRIKAVSLNSARKNPHALKSDHGINFEGVFTGKAALIFISIFACLSQFETRVSSAKSMAEYQLDNKNWLCHFGSL
jgi:hypothetical protein